jgi:HPt (histidine-containing phosphotransfer) domain-containing protein
MDDFLSKPFHPASLSRVLSVHAAPAPSPSKPPAGELDLDAKRSEKLIRMFLAKVPEQVTSLASAIDGGRIADVKALAHKLKGSCAALAAVRMGDVARALEHAASAGDLALVRRHFDELKTRERAVNSALEAELKQNFPAPGPTSQPS